MANSIILAFGGWFSTLSSEQWEEFRPDELVDVRVEDLSPRINNNYEPENRELPPITYDKSAEINQKLPKEVIQLAFSYLGFRDLTAVSMVSQYWARTTLEMARNDNALIKSLGAFLIKEIPDAELKNQLAFTQDIDLLKEKNLCEQTKKVLEVRYKIIEILSNLDHEALKKLEISSLDKRRPASFDALFELVRVQSQFMPISYTTHNLADKYVSDFCKLKAYDMAQKALTSIGIKKGRGNQIYYSALQHIASPLLELGKFNKVKELANTAKDNAAKSRIVYMCIDLGKIDEAYDLAKGLSVSLFSDYSVLKPIVKMVEDRKFNKAIELKNKLTDLSCSTYANRIITKSFEQACYKLIQGAKFDEVRSLVVLLGKAYDGSVDKVCKALVIGYIKSDRFDEAFELVNTFVKENLESDAYLATINAMLHEKGQSDNTKKINEINIRFIKSRLEIDTLYGHIGSEKFDEAIAGIKQSKLCLRLAAPYLTKKLLEAGKRDQAIEVAFMITDLAVRVETLKMFQI